MIWHSSICSLFLFITFFLFFLVSLIRHSFDIHLCFDSSLRWRISETKMADSPEKITKTKKFEVSFQCKTKYNTTWFSQENSKSPNHEFQVRGSFFLPKICTKNILFIHDFANDLVRNCNSVTHQKREKEKHAEFFYSENDIINDIM